MAFWSQLEMEALYLGLRDDYGNDYDAIKYHYQVELRNRSANTCRNKMINDNKRYVKRQLLLQELLQEQLVLHINDVSMLTIYLRINSPGQLQ